MKFTRPVFSSTLSFDIEADEKTHRIVWERNYYNYLSWDGRKELIGRNRVTIPNYSSRVIEYVDPIILQQVRSETCEKVVDFLDYIFNRFHKEDFGEDKTIRNVYRLPLFMTLAP